MKETYRNGRHTHHWRARRLGSRIARVACAFAVAAMPWSVATGQTATVLYETGFETFPVGDDQLVGFDGWDGENVGEQVHGIDDSIVPGLGKSGFLGFSPPSDTFVRVFRPVDYDALAQGTPVIEFFALIGIQESTTGGSDYFYITVLNSDRQALAAIRFRVTVAGIQTWRFDGATMHSGLGGLVAGEVMPLLIRIDFDANRWSAEWGGAPLFNDAPFTARPVTRDLGAFAAEWQIAAPASPGNNWMLFDDWAIEALIPPPIVIADASLNNDGSFSLTWIAEAGASYVVEWSSNLVVWRRDLPNSSFAAQQAGPLTFTHSDALSGAERIYYRVVRTFAAPAG